MLLLGKVDMVSPPLSHDWWQFSKGTKLTAWIYLTRGAHHIGLHGSSWINTTMAACVLDRLRTLAAQSMGLDALAVTVSCEGWGTPAELWFSLHVGRLEKLGSDVHEEWWRRRQQQQRRCSHRTSGFVLYWLHAACICSNASQKKN